MEKISPGLLREIYYNEGYVVCKNSRCARKIAGVYLRDYCGCVYCKSGTDDYCVTVPIFSKSEITCPFCEEIIKYVKRRS